MWIVCWTSEHEFYGFIEEIKHWERCESAEEAESIVRKLTENGVPEDSILIFGPDSEMTVKDLRALCIGRAILEEAMFEGIDLTEGEIEHQLGTVWVGDYAISVTETEPSD